MNKLTIWPAWFLLLFFICFGLGYPTLNRYNPPEVHGLTDAQQYYRLVEQGPHAAFGHWKYRILVPYLAKPVYWIVQGRLRSWNPISFALLAVNSAFCAAAATLLSVLVLRLYQIPMLAVTASFAYLLNFAVANYQLSGLVDSAEAFWFLALTWALMTRRWLLLPIIGLLAGLSKETFVPIAFIFAAAWVLSEPNREWVKAGAAIVALAVVALITVVAVRSTIEHTLITPWQIAAQEEVVSAGVFHNFVSIIRNWTFWLTLMWLPFLFLAAKRISKAWRYSALAGAAITLMLAVWNNAGGGNTARPMFNVLGPVLALSFALTAEGAGQADLRPRRQTV